MSNLCVRLLFLLRIDKDGNRRTAVYTFIEYRKYDEWNNNKVLEDVMSF